MSEPKIIGGVFGRETGDPVSTEPVALHLPAHVRRIDLAAARCAIRLLATHTGTARVWIPSYVCASVVDVIPRDKTRFYAIGRDWSGAPDGVTRNDLFVSIAYFGRAHDETAIRLARTQGAITVLDATQCVPDQSLSTAADFVIYSPRKVMGVPDGGILLDLTGHLPLPLDFPPAPRDWHGLAQACFELRSIFDARGGTDEERPWLDFQYRWEAEFPPGIWAMSHTTRAMLESAVRLSQIRARRRANHDALTALLSLVPETEGASAPLGCVIVFEDERLRDLIRSALMFEQIYPAVHWQLPAAVPACFAESRSISSRILTIPCDQRYDLCDMERIADVLRRGMKVRRSAGG